MGERLWLLEAGQVAGAFDDGERGPGQPGLHLLVQPDGGELVLASRDQVDGHRHGGELRG